VRAGIPVPSSVPTRPARPVLVELASAIMVVGGVMGVLSSVDVMSRLAAGGDSSIGPLIVLSILIGIASVALGVLIRFGRGWIVALNLTAIAAFLELTSGSIVGLVFGLLDGFVVVVLLVEQRWFRWTPESDEPVDDR
jgi:hypothetical protein